MSNEDYDAGRYGQVPTGQDWGAYNQGRWDRERWEQATNPPTRSSGGSSTYGSGGGGTGGGGGGGIGLLVVFGLLLFVLVIALLVALWASLAALVAALVLAGSSQLGSRPAQLAFPNAFKGAFWAMMILMGTSASISAINYALIANNMAPEFLNGINHTVESIAVQTLQRTEQSPTGSAMHALMSAFAAQVLTQPGATLKMLVLFWGPGLLLGAIPIRRRMGPAYSGFLGYLKSVLVALVSLVPSLAITNVVLLQLAERAQLARLGDAVWPEAAAVAGLAVLGYALVGGFLAALVLWLVLRFALRVPADGLGRSYGAFLTGSLVYGITIVAALYLFRQGDALMQWVYTVVLAPDPWAAAAAMQHQLWPALWAFLPLQVPGVLLCAGIVTARLGRGFDGYLGYGKAMVVCGVFALVLLLPFLYLTFAGMAHGWSALGGVPTAPSPSGLYP